MNLSWIALAVALAIFWILYQFEKKHVNFGLRTIFAMLFGLILGFAFQGHTEYVSIFGTIFTRLISAIVVPLLLFSIIHSISKLNNLERLKSLGLRSLFWLLLNTFLASTLTLIIAGSLKVGSGFNLTLPTDATAKEVPTIIETLVSFFPSNIVEHAASNQVIPIIIFAIMVGIALVHINTKNETQGKILIDFAEAMNALIGQIVKSIIKLTPYAVVAFIANVVTRDSAKDLTTFVSIILIAYGISMIQTYLVHGTLVLLFGKMNPIKFFKGIFEAQVVAFTSQSSIGTVPVTVERLIHKLDVKEDVASFVSGLGANTGMPGCTGMWPMLLAIFSINALNIPFTPIQYVLLIVYSIIVSFGTAGVPGTATISATAVLTAAGLPIEIIVVLAPISALVDMARTATNVTGAATAAVIVDAQMSH
ncbi:sodium:dicarboxylate symporter [Erysipelothrix larvae]|uniref:L-cystine uptake protein TcyP n=1 Tax=Erysipelothrix larvae TaxID=1514105 RepID=A0A109UH37_9FIRM|nr:dicarboxylate/amino acid:cation symporter [Erysipelothrix larvae]AMC93632.1 sodium:dicarboxylate symporter [Erysipelothrix larvae]